MRISFLNSSALTQPNWAPPGEGGPGYEDEDLGGNQDLDLSLLESEEDENNELGENNDEINVDPEEILKTLLPGAGDESLDDDDFNADETQKALVAQMETDLAGFKIEDSDYPDNFNPANKEHLNQLLNVVADKAMRTAINTMFKPTQASIERLGKIQERNMKQALIDFKGNQSTHDTLVKAIPAAASAEIREIISPLLKNALKIHKGDTKTAIAAVRKGMVAMGMNPNQAPARKTETKSRTLFKGLDTYLAPIKASKPTAQTRDKLKA